MKHAQTVRLASWDRRPGSGEMDRALTDLRQAIRMLFFADADHSTLEEFVERVFAELRIEEARLIARAVREADAVNGTDRPKGFCKPESPRQNTLSTPKAKPEFDFTFL